MPRTPNHDDPPRAAPPELVVLDVNETLTDLSPMGPAFAGAGLDAAAAEAWFAQVLRDAFALTVLGDNPSFADIASASLRVRLAAAGAPEPAAAATGLMQRFTELDPHPDVVPGVLALAAAGCRVVTLSNGSAGVARRLLEHSPAGAVIEDYLSVEAAGRWKPAPEAYAHALASTSVSAARAMLVAVHPWDVAGARRAGLRTAWINRDAADYPDHVDAAELEASSLTDLASAFTD